MPSATIARYACELLTSRCQERLATIGSHRNDNGTEEHRCQTPRPSPLPPSPGSKSPPAWCGPRPAASARSALARIRGVVPPDLLDQVDDARVYTLRFGRGDEHFDVVHRAIGARRRLVIDYAGEDGQATADRVIRPLGLYFWGKVWTLAAWCELRNDFRSFRVHRIDRPRLADEFDEEPQKTLEVFLARVRA